MEYQETTEATGDLVGKKIANRITKVSKKLLHNNSQRVTIENDTERPKEIYISLKERLKIIDDLRLI